MKKAMPVVLAGYGIPGPVGVLEVLENDPHILILPRVIRPDIVCPLFGVFGRLTGTLKPGMRIRGVVDHQFGNDFQVALVRLFHEMLEYGDIAIRGIDIVVIGDIVTVVFEGEG